MAAAMIYDTLRLAERLEHEAGFDAARAKAVARILAENAGGNLATREDLLLVKGELLAEMRALASDLNAKIGALDGKIGALEGKITALEGKVRVLYWMTGTTLAGVASLLGTAIAIALHVMHLG